MERTKGGALLVRLRVRELAEQHGIADPAKLSRAAGIAYATAYRVWETGELDETGSDKGPGLLILRRIAQAIGVKTSELYEEDRRAAALARGW